METNSLQLPRCVSFGFVAAALAADWHSISVSTSGFSLVFLKFVEHHSDEEKIITLVNTLPFVN